MDDADFRSARDDRRQAILAIARDVFVEEGFAAASMSAIAARLGGSKGTLYNYFRSKQALFTAVVEEQCTRHTAELFQMDGFSEDVAEMLALLGRRALRMMLSEEVLSMHRIVVAECVRFPEIGEALYEAGPRRGKLPLINYLTQAIADGRLKAGDPYRMAGHAMELMLAGLYRRRLWNVGAPPTEAEMEDNVTAAVEVFMAAYGLNRPAS